MKARALRTGSVLGVVSPASAARAELVAAGCAELERAGYRTKVFPHALARGPLYYAGTAEQRAGDLRAAFADAEVDAVICTRGGYGSVELLPLLDHAGDVALIRESGKAFIGYSDHTSLQVWLGQVCGVVTFYGPMVAADWSGYQAPGQDGVDRASWAAAFGGASGWSVAAGRVLRAGSAEGVLRGGCLALVTEGLGTPYGFRAEGGVLFLEDIGVKPYQWDRMLSHLRLAGMLEEVTGIVLGDMAQSCAADEQALLEGAILHALREFTGPVAMGLRSGHVDRGNVTLPLGVQVRLDCDGGNPRLHFLEAAVEG